MIFIDSVQHPFQFEIYPWIHGFSNWISAKDQTAVVRIPDIVPGNIPEKTDFSMVAGDFCDIYASPEHFKKWNAVVTCFFIDTAKNLIEYVEIISSILTENGVWINHGKKT